MSIWSSSLLLSVTSAVFMNIFFFHLVALAGNLGVVLTPFPPCTQPASHHTHCFCLCDISAFQQYNRVTLASDRPEFSFQFHHLLFFLAHRLKQSLLPSSSKWRNNTYWQDSCAFPFLHGLTEKPLTGLPASIALLLTHSVSREDSWISHKNWPCV